jgi:predicted patatin/cPLA2 family phospholipase
MSKLLETEKDDFEFLGGNSVGTLTSCFLGQYPMGEMNKGLKELLSIWHGLTSGKDLWKINLFSFFKALYDNGISNPAPLQELIRTKCDLDKVKRSGRTVRISTVDVLKGEAVEYGEDNLTWQNIYGSTAMPFGCPAIQTADGKYLTDGGVLVSGPLGTAIKMGYRDITIVLNGPISKKKRIKPVTVKEVKRMDRFALRILDMIMDFKFVQQMKLCLLYNLLAQNELTDKVEVNVRIFAPSDTLASGMILMELEPDLLRQWYEEGRNTKPVDIETFISNLG